MQLQALTALAASAGYLSLTAASWVPYFDNLVTFGDSYTDESRLGYFINHHGAAPPPGLLLPSSNSTPGGGITWDRFVSDSTGAKLYNYAVSGAVCSNKMIYRNLAAINGPFPDVVYEVDAFIADVNYVNASTKTNTLYTNRRSSNTVYSMWIGTNDLGVDAFLTDSSLGMSTISDYVDCVFERFDSLYKEGGRYFVLINTAPLELSPLYGMPGVGGLNSSHYWADKPANITQISSKMKQYTTLANSLFTYRTPYELLIAHRYPDANFAVFDVHSLLTDIYHNPTAFGLSEPAVVDRAYYTCDDSGAKCEKSALGLDHFMWFDELHPGQQTDRAVAREFVEVVGGKSGYARYWR